MRGTEGETEQLRMGEMERERGSGDTEPRERGGHRGQARPSSKGPVLATGQSLSLGLSLGLSGWSVEEDSPGEQSRGSRPLPCHPSTALRSLLCSPPPTHRSQVPHSTARIASPPPPPRSASAHSHCPAHPPPPFSTSYLSASTPLSTTTSVISFSWLVLITPSPPRSLPLSHTPTPPPSSDSTGPPLPPSDERLLPLHLHPTGLLSLSLLPLTASSVFCSFSPSPHHYSSSLPPLLLGLPAFSFPALVGCWWYAVDVSVPAGAVSGCPLFYSLRLLSTPPTVPTPSAPTAVHSVPTTSGQPPTTLPTAAGRPTTAAPTTAAPAAAAVQQQHSLQLQQAQAQLAAQSQFPSDAPATPRLVQCPTCQSWLSHTTAHFNFQCPTCRTWLDVTPSSSASPYNTSPLSSPPISTSTSPSLPPCPPLSPPPRPSPPPRLPRRSARTPLPPSARRTAT